MESKPNSRVGKAATAAQQACLAKKTAEAKKAIEQREAARRAARGSSSLLDEASLEDRRMMSNYKKEAVRIQEKLDEARLEREELEKEQLETASRGTTGFVTEASNSGDAGSIDVLLYEAVTSAWSYVSQAAV